MKHTLFFTVVAFLLAACGGDDGPGKGPVEIETDMDSMATDMSTSDLSNTADMQGDMPLEDMTEAVDLGVDMSATSDAGVDMGEETSPLVAETFFEGELDLIANASLRTPIELTDFSTDVELMIVKELEGFTELQNADSGAAVLAVNEEAFLGPESGIDSGPLPQGMYNLFLENFGGTGTGYNDLVVFKVIRAPGFAASEAVFERTVLEETPFLTAGNGYITEFSTRDGYRYVARGIRGKSAILIANADQRAAVEAGMPFRSEYEWNVGSSGLEPRAQELELPAGDYIAIIGNEDTTAAHGAILKIDEWREL